MVLGSSSLKGKSFLCLVTGILAPMSVWPNVYDIIRASSSYHLHSVSGQQMFERSSASVDRDTGHESSPGGLRSKRTASAHGLNMSTEGRTEHWTLNIKIRFCKDKNITSKANQMRTLRLWNSQCFVICAAQFKMFPSAQQQQQSTVSSNNFCKSNSFF